MKVPFLDLKAQYSSIKDEIDAAVSAVIQETAFISGKFAEQFEEAFANYLGVDHCIGCANGTDAIEMALAAIGLQPDDEVIVPANSFIATSEAVTTAGGRVVFADVDPTSYNITVETITPKITDKTKAVIAVHLYGNPVDMDPIIDIAGRQNLKIFEDSAQAHGALYKGRHIGTIGDAGTFSFYPGKNLGAYGDAGAIVTNNAEINVFCRRIKNHGRLDKFDHELEGRNSRLDGIQGAILEVKLKHLEKWLEGRRSVAERYNELLSDVAGLTLPVQTEDSRHVYHLYVIQVDNRDEVRSRLKERGVSTGVHYPVALPFLGAYQHLKHSPADFPVAHRAMSRILSLPMCPELSQEQIEYVAENVKACL